MKIRLVALLIVVSMIAAFALTGCELINQFFTTTTTITTAKTEEEPPKAYSNEVQVILLLGQSNAEGHTQSQYLNNYVMQG